MTYEGRVKNGVIVLDEAVQLKEGIRVRVELAADMEEQKFPTLAERLASVIGKADGLPADMSENLDKYILNPPE